MLCHDAVSRAMALVKGVSVCHQELEGLKMWRPRGKTESKQTGLSGPEDLCCVVADRLMSECGSHPNAHGWTGWIMVHGPSQAIPTSLAYLRQNPQCARQLTRPPSNCKALDIPRPMTLDCNMDQRPDLVDLLQHRKLMLAPRV
jgi:hypothetical protein